MTFYKIRNKNTGLFSKGGQNPRFTKNGKTWNNLGHVKTHLNLHTGSAYYGRGRVNQAYLDSIEVVEYNFVAYGEWTETIIEGLW